MKIPSEVTIDGVVYNTRWMVTGQGSFVERLEILVSKVIYITLEKCTADVSNRDKDEIRHLLAKNLALCDFFEKNKESLFNNSPTLPERVLDTESLTEARRRFSSVAYHCNDSVQKDKNKDSVSIEGATMSEIAQLISDMTAAGASREELSRVINHSIAVINVEEAILDRDKSFFNNSIVDLFKKYHR